MSTYRTIELGKSCQAIPTSGELRSLDPQADSWNDTTIAQALQQHPGLFVTALRRGKAFKRAEIQRRREADVHGRIARKRDRLLGMPKF